MFSINITYFRSESWILFTCWRPDAFGPYKLAEPNTSITWCSIHLQRPVRRYMPTLHLRSTYTLLNATSHHIYYKLAVSSCQLPEVTHSWHPRLTQLTIPVGRHIYRLQSIVPHINDHNSMHGSSSSCKNPVASLQAYTASQWSYLWFRLSLKLWLSTQFTKFSWAYQRDPRYPNLAHNT